MELPQHACEEQALTSRPDGGSPWSRAQAPQAGGLGSVWRVASPAPPTSTVGATRTCRSSLPGRLQLPSRPAHLSLLPFRAPTCAAPPLGQLQPWSHPVSPAMVSLVPFLGQEGPSMGMVGRGAAW